MSEKYSKWVQQQPLLLHHILLELALKVKVVVGKRGKTGYYVFGYHRYVTIAEWKNRAWVIQAYNLRGTLPLASIELFPYQPWVLLFPHLLGSWSWKGIYRYTLLCLCTLSLYFLLSVATEPGILPTVYRRARSDGRLVKKVLLNNRKFPLLQFRAKYCKS